MQRCQHLGSKRNLRRILAQNHLICCWLEQATSECSDWASHLTKSPSPPDSEWKLNCRFQHQGDLALAVNSVLAPLFGLVWPRCIQWRRYPFEWQMSECCKSLRCCWCQMVLVNWLGHLHRRQSSQWAQRWRFESATKSLNFLSDWYIYTINEGVLFSQIRFEITRGLQPEM